VRWLVHPGLVLVLGAFALPWLRGGARSAAVLALPLAALVCLWQLPEGARWQTAWLGYELAPLSVDSCHACSPPSSP
jgi:hypothetical protein